MQEFKILVVDDDKNVVYTLGEILKMHDWKVDIAENGYDAIKMCKENKYDAILLDVNMPGIDGIETYSEIKKMQSQGSVIMMTAGSTDQLRGLYDMGISTIIQKPVEIKDITNMISKLEKKGNVLVIDDNVNDAALLKDIFEEKGFNVKVAGSGLEAINIFEKEKFDIVLLDLRLPDIEGVQVLDRIKKINPSIPVIAVTGFSLDGVIDDVISKGAYTCFLKPFNIELLFREVNNAVYKKQKKLSSDKKETLVKVLLVENDPNLIESMKNILEEEGICVKNAKTMDEVKKRLEESDFNLVVSDLGFEKETELSLVNTVKDKDKSTIFMLLSDQRNLDAALEEIKKNVDEVILKPIKPTEFLHKVKTCLEKQKLEAEKEKLIEKLQETNIRLLELSKTDELTGAYNRRYMFEQLHNEVQRSKRLKTPVCFMMCDVHGFKKYNNSKGHAEGDKILRETVSIIKSVIRQYVDQIFRYGGDEFAILVPGIEEKNAEMMAARIIEKIKERFQLQDIGINIGMMCSNAENVRSINEIVDMADRKMNDSKKTGKNITIK